MGIGSMPRAPQAPAPPPMPIDPSVIERRRRALRMRRSGQRSTILTTPRGVVNRGTVAAPALLGGTAQPAAGG